MLLDLFIAPAHAQAAGASSPLGALLFPVLMIVVFYFFLIRPQMKRAKEHRNMIADLKSGDEVLTNGGLIGKIVKINDSSIDLQLTDSVTVKHQKAAISALLPKGSMKE